MLKLSENPVMSHIPEAYDGNHEYMVETHGPMSTFYMRMTPEIKRIVEELMLRSSEGGMTPLHVPNGNLPSAVIIYGDKALTLKERLEAEGYTAISNSKMPLENRTQQQS